MNAKISALEKYGMDMKTTMERFSDDEEFYLECLTEFTINSGMDKLKAALDKEDYATAFDYAHTLKGVIGNLGLTPLFIICCELVEPLRHREIEKVPAAYAAFAAEFDRLMAILKSAG